MAEIARLKNVAEGGKRVPQYQRVNLWTRISQLEWVLRIASPFDDEA